MKRFCLALDLKDNKDMIRLYEEHHKAVWPEVIESIKASGILAMEIYRTGNRLFMIMETSDDFSFEKKHQADAVNPRVAAWETLMSTYQLPLPWSKAGEKWMLMENIFQWKNKQ